MLFRSRCAAITREPDDEEAHVLLFHRLQEASPNLQKIEISPTYNRPAGDDLVVGPRLVQELLSFDRLRELGVYGGYTQPAFILDLITKPNLTSLRIGCIPGPLRSSSPVLVQDLLELSIVGTGPILVGRVTYNEVCRPKGELPLRVADLPSSDPR